MRLYLLFCTVLAFFCAVSTHTHAQVSPSRDCPELKVEAEITHTSAGADNAQILLKFEESSPAEQYLIYRICSNCAEPTKPVDLAFRNLRAGLHDIYIIGKDGCVKQLNIQVN